eukprot:TRINITY_DN29913_c0_g1_i1.p2 TRINITY_DN29913_c0_g1~~TRINITY_DN29913_c0_g1_i1.p2  ORF type:complete len:254 (+),score=74.17 TRINITY_DN29913_c0_g1_i1:111-872(+)
MDICSALAAHASKKHLRRLAAALGLQADAPGSLAALLETPPDAARAAVTQVFKKAPKEAQKLWAVVEEWMAEGPPEGALADPEEEDVGGGEEDGGEAEPPLPRSANACVECGKDTPFVFILLGCRLCERCEKRGGRYTLVPFPLAKSIHGLQDRDLHALNGHGEGISRVFLRADVEACAARAHQTAEKEVAALRAAAKKAWRAESFATDHKGHTHKWKQWNTHTYQQTQAIRKMTADPMMANLMELSGLVHVG